MRRFFLPFAALVLLVALASCAAPPAKQRERFESAEHKNLVEFMRAYQAAWNARDETAILRLYDEKAREAPLLFLGNRVLNKETLVRDLSLILKAQNKADLHQEILGPITYHVAGDQAEVKAVARISYLEDRQPQSGYLLRTFSLHRVTYFWRIQRSHFEFIPAGPQTEGLVPL